MCGQYEINLQAWVGYDFKLEDQIKVYMGLGYWVGDVVKIFVGFDYKDLWVVVVFDLNVFQYCIVIDFQGVFEIVVFYIFKIYKELEIKLVIFCLKF